MLPVGRNLLRAAVANPALRRGLRVSVPKNGGIKVYRSPPAHPPVGNLLAAEIYSGIMWTWIFYRLFNDWEVFTNEWPYPDMSKWSDAELGIPPLDEDD